MSLREALKLLWKNTFMLYYIINYKEENSKNHWYNYTAQIYAMALVFLSFFNF